MTTQVPAAIKYVRYNRGLGDQFDWDAARGIAPATIFEVTPGGLPRLLRYLNGDESERAYFTPVDEAYAATLRRCVGCRVYFEFDHVERRHVAWHEQRAAASAELRRLQRLDVDDAMDRDAVREAELRIVERDRERQQLHAVVEAAGLAPSIEDGR